MIAWFAKNSVASNLLMISIVAFGLFSLTKLTPLEIFPDFASDEVSISMSLKGATPQDVEEGITIKIEEAIADLEGITDITSSSSEGSASISVELDSSYNSTDLLADIKSRVDAINTFPDDADRAVIKKSVHSRAVIDLTITSIYGEKELREYAQNVKDELLQINGISQVSLLGVRDFEISIEVSQDTLLEYGLSISDISSAISSSSLDLSSGNLKTNAGDILVSLKGQAYTKDSFSSIIIKKDIDGSVLRLEDIAKISDGFEESKLRARFNGQNAIIVKIKRIGKQSAIAVADKVKDYISSKQDYLPVGYEVSYWDDDSTIVKSRLSTLLTNAIQGSILIIILLTLFLRPAIAFWVFIGIPVSFAGAFFVMPLFDVSLNVLSLFGFILVLGIVVDDAIVTGENIYTHLRTSESSEMAVINGTKEISVPVTFGVLTTIAAFIPLLFVDGDRSGMFTQIPFIVIPVLIFSLIESKFILPSHLKHIKLRQDKNKTNKFEQWQERFADGFEAWVLKYYSPILNLAIKNKINTLLVFISALVIIISLIMGGWMKFTFFPRVPSERVEVTLTMPAGTPFETTNKHILYLTKKAEDLQKKYMNKETNTSVIENILSITGGRGGATSGSVRFEITPPEKRDESITSTKLANEFRRSVGEIVGAQSTEYRAEFGRSGEPIDIQLTGSSLEHLKLVANEIKGELNNYDNVFDITDTLTNGKDELRIELTQEGKLLNITKQEVSSQVRQALYGLKVQTIQRGKDDISVMIRYPLNQRKSIDNLNSIIITTQDGNKIPLGNIAKLTSNKSPSSIRRVNRYRTINVRADIEKSNTNVFALQNDLKIYLEELLVKYPDVKYTLEGEAREQEEAFSSLGYSLLFALFAIYVLLAIPFKSYAQPLIVMSVIPFGIIGAVIGHWILGMNLTVLSLMGMLALTGILVNDSLVLVDYINKQYKKTNDLLHSVITAGAARFRPVMLTSLTTFIGLLPLIFEKSTDAQFLIPMAVSLAFGVLFATFTTLILVPVNYMLLNKFIKIDKNIDS